MQYETSSQNWKTKIKITIHSPGAEKNADPKKSAIVSVARNRVSRIIYLRLYFDVIAVANALVVVVAIAVIVH